MRLRIGDAGFVDWDDINSGVNWGVVLLYAAVISLGLQMKDTGAARWFAEGFLSLMEPLGGAEGLERGRQEFPKSLPRAFRQAL